MEEEKAEVFGRCWNNPERKERARKEYSTVSQQAKEAKGIRIEGGMLVGRGWGYPR